MNVSSLLLGPDRHTCHLELNSLSDQERMELLFDALDSASSEDFKNATGAYKDVCKWRGVKCNGRRRVVYIEIFHSISGTLNLSYLPERIETFTHVFEKEEIQSAYGTLDTSALPSQLSYLNLAFLKLNGTVDLRRLPSAMKDLDLEANDFSGSVQLISLPKNLQELSLEVFN